ncbi:glucose-6-phosphate dehydrogenase [Siminovitchia acidinfaciens]|uniref:Glucose-6-phosphate 1-dehydrogenase n=2 Tax=Siminovitchia acidinfaciens TaxID=2321395 RepID=A0A429Y5A4_9BACI|nr:glucose-6-phosphate dehydrogenase [Siminovitchia acidinfaciens]
MTVSQESPTGAANSNATKGNEKLDSMTFVLFGATGDLAKRKIFPTLYNLFLDNKLPDPFAVIALGRKNFSSQAFRLHVLESLKIFSRRFPENTDSTETFLQMIHYHSLNATDNQGYLKLVDYIKHLETVLRIPENRLFYLSMAPEFIDTVTSNIKKSGLDSINGWKRLVIEKPFGFDLSSAQNLNNKLGNAFDEAEIYRIDHYLGKSMVQNLEVLKFANPMFQDIWNKENISNVQITASETVGVEERADYYDQAGAIRDMFQNHMLQILMMTAMQQPKKLNSKEIRKEKLKVMEALQPLQKENICSSIIRGQYEAGAINGIPVKGYREEPGVESLSKNDTFIAAKVLINHPAWYGVPFYIRTGKRMKEKSTRIVIEFKKKLSIVDAKDSDKTIPNLLTIEVNKEGISLQLNIKNPETNKIEPASFSFSANNGNTPAEYELLLYDVFRGNSTFFAHWKEVELAWKWVQPALEAFEKSDCPLHTYPAGSLGPVAADQLLKHDGFKWW